MNYFLKHIILIKYKYLFLLFGFMFLQKETFSQINIVKDVYNTFDGRSINVHLIQGRYTAVCFDTSRITSSQLKDSYLKH